MTASGRRIRVLPYRVGSRSAKTLSRELGALQLRLANSKYRYRCGDMVINWGNSRFDPELTNGEIMPILNHPACIEHCSNKLKFFQTMSSHLGDILPKFWTNKEEIPENEYPIVCRTVLNGHSGAGIIIADSPADLVDAPLYVKYVPKKEEYRVHVGKDGDGATQLISVQRKARRHATPDGDVNWRVRNLANGFIFMREGVVLPVSAEAAAREALAHSGLDFGAVDVIYNASQDKAYILEINTAPGLVGTTVKDYGDYFRGL